MDVVIDPTNKELLAIIGALWAENDSLRERMALAGVRFSKRTFSNEDLISGASLGIKARVLRNGNIVLETDS